MADSAASLDQQLDLKKRARRRLVGATALALLAAVVLPMVMDHEPRPPNQDLQVRIPSPDASGGIAARVLSAKPTPTPLPPAATATAAPAEPKAQAPAKAEPPLKSEAKAEAVAPKAAVAAAPLAAATKTAAKPADPPTDKEAEEPRAATAPAGDAAVQWVVQLGAYREAGNVKLLLAKLKGVGVPAYTEKFDSPQGPRTRVRAGPFASKEAAEKARTKIKIIGVDGPVAAK